MAAHCAPKETPTSRANSETNTVTHHNWTSVPNAWTLKESFEVYCNKIQPVDPPKIQEKPETTTSFSTGTASSMHRGARAEASDSGCCTRGGPAHISQFLGQKGNLPHKIGVPEQKKMWTLIWPDGCRDLAIKFCRKESFWWSLHIYEVAGHMIEPRFGICRKKRFPQHGLHQSVFSVLKSLFLTWSIWNFA